MNNLTRFALWLLAKYAGECLACSGRTDHEDILLTLKKYNMPYDKLRLCCKIERVGETKKLSFTEDCNLGEPYTLVAELELVSGEKADVDVNERHRVDYNKEKLSREIDKIAAKEKKRKDLAEKWTQLESKLTKFASELSPRISAISAEITSSEFYAPELQDKMVTLWTKLTELQQCKGG